MTPITPRWEWRSFGRRFGQAEQRLARLTPSGVQESDELYLLSGADGTWRTVVDRAELTRLGEGLEQQGVISDAALERTVAAIAGMVDEAKRHGVRALAAVGTAGVRARHGCG